MQIPRWPVSDEREKRLIDEVLSSRQWGGFHEFVTRFEEKFAAYQHCAHGVSAANGTVTLEMLFAAVGVVPGDEVIVPAISFISTATAVSRVGGVPVFVDIEPYSFNMDPEQVEAAISPRTKAICVVHFGGPLADVDRLLAIGAKYGIPVVEDAAHAHGSEWNGRRAGSFGLCSSFSFQNGKVLTAGEGGMVLTQDAALAAEMRSMANQGRRPGATHFHHFTLGTNLRLTALQAAVLLVGLDRLDEQIARRTRNATLLLDQLLEFEGIRWQQLDPRMTRNSWYLLLGRIDERKFGMDRDAFHKAMQAAGVPCTPFYPHTLYQNPLYRDGIAPCRVLPCPNAEASIRDAFWLPHVVLLGDEQLTLEIVGAIKQGVTA